MNLLTSGAGQVMRVICVGGSYPRNKICNSLHSPIPEEGCCTKSSTDIWHTQNFISAPNLGQVPEKIFYHRSRSETESMEPHSQK